MASKVLNAKRHQVTATYDFLDGTSTAITVQSISTNEGKEIDAVTKQEGKTGADLFEKIIRIHLHPNEADTVNRIVTEQYEEGNLIDFANALGELIQEAKKGK